MKSLLLLMAGVLAGWILHEVIYPRDPRLTPVETLASGQTVNEELDASSVATLQAPDKTLSQLDSDPDTGATVLSRIIQQPEPCNPTADILVPECRQEILSLQVSNHTSRFEFITQLEAWMQQYPGDIEIGLKLIDQTVADEQFTQALQLLGELKSYQYDPVAVDRIDDKTWKIAQLALDHSSLQNHSGQLQQFLSMISRLQPVEAKWKYALARAQQAGGEHEAAIDTLTYILFDPVYGGQANTLYQTLTREMDLGGYQAVPVTRLGSQFLVNVTINRRHQLPLLIDTGASITSIYQPVMEAIGIPPNTNKQITLATAGGDIKVALTELGELSIGNLPIAEIEIANLPGDPGAVQGLLGMDYLGNFRFVIDQTKLLLYLTPR